MRTSVDAQLHEIHKLAFFIENGLLPNEYTPTVKRLRALSQSKEHKVRFELARIFAKSPFLPKDIAIKLANDDRDISHIIIAEYQRFEASEIINIIESRVDNEGAMSAVAHRKHLTSKIMEYLCDNASTSILYILIAHHKQNMKPEIISRILNKFTDKIDILKIIKTLKVDQDDIIQLVNDHVKSIISEHLKIKSESIPDFSTLDLSKLNSDNFGKSAKETELKAIIDNLFAKNCLSYIILIRSLCRADLYSFTYALGKYTGLPFLKIRDFIYDLDFPELKTLLSSIGIPATLTNAIIALLEIIVNGLKTKQLETDNFANYLNQKLYENDLLNNTEMKYIHTLIGKTHVQKILLL